MAAPEFSRLTDTNLRDAWQDEARDFTPWLAENISYLCDAVGMTLDVSDTEVAVDQFSADIVAEDTETGARVLIENQLERSDHRHLGQIMTYLAGVEAKAVVWIAPSFTDAHLSAIKWLNENTKDEMGFFAVRLRVVRIGSGPLAPLFETLTQPNNWERGLEKKTNEAEAHRTALREAFWLRYDELHPGVLVPNRASNVWIPATDDGKILLSLYTSAKSTGLFVRGQTGDRDQIYEFITKHGDFLSTKLGIPVNWHEKSGHCLWDAVEIPLAQRDRWDEAINWLEKRRQDYMSTIASAQ